MSRRKEDFAHRTSIFEGAFRAWSHLGGLELADLQNKAVSELDPLNHPIEDDPRLFKEREKTGPHLSDERAAQSRGTEESSRSEGQERNFSTGSASPAASTTAATTGCFLGKGGGTVDDTIESASTASVTNATVDSSTFSSNLSQSGSTVRQPHHRVYPYEALPRSGLSHSFVKAIIAPWLGDNATGEQKQLGLTTLRTWWQHRRKGETGTAVRDLGTEKMRFVVEGYTRSFFEYAHHCVTQGMEQPPRTLAAKIKEAEKRTGTKILFCKQESPFDNGKSLKISDLLPLSKTKDCCSSSTNQKGRGSVTLNNDTTTTQPLSQSDLSPQYGDPNMTPVVFISANGDIQIALKIKGIACGNCVKIIETVLKGIDGKKPPIPGLIDAAGDRELASVLVKLEKSSDARRVAFEADINLKKVGYESKAVEMGINDSAGRKTIDMNMLVGAFDIVANIDSKDVFDWSLPCTCPNNGDIKDDCPRHSQMNKRIFEAFEKRQKEVTGYMAGCGTRLGMDCSCGTNCKCKSGSCVCGKKAQSSQSLAQSSQQTRSQHQLLPGESNANFQGVERINPQSIFQNDNLNGVPYSVTSLHNNATPSMYHNQHQPDDFFGRTNDLQLLLQQQHQQEPNINSGLPRVNMNTLGAASGNDLNQLLLMQQAQHQQLQQQSQMQQDLHDNNTYFNGRNVSNEVGLFNMNGFIGQNPNISMVGGPFNHNGSVPADFNHNNMMMGLVNTGRMNPMEQWGNQNIHSTTMEELVETDL